MNPGIRLDVLSGMVLARRERTLHWALVLVGVAALVCTPAVVDAATTRFASSTSLTAAQVVSLARRSAGVAHSGLVQIDGRVGLPSLPFGNDATAQLDHSTRVRTWWVSDSHWRTDILSATGQQDEFAIPRGTLGWDYERDTVTIRPASSGLRLPRTADLMPPAASRLLLAWVGPAERIHSLGVRRLAGRTTSGAEVSSGEAASSVSRLDVWVDPASGLPLALDVYVRRVGVPVFSTRFLDLSTDRPDPSVIAPVLSAQAHWTTQRGDLLSFIQDIGSTDFPVAVADLPRLGGPPAAIPAGIATYGSGFARAALLQLPRRLVPQIQAALTDQTLQVVGARVAVLRSPLVQVALIEPSAGGGYLLVGAVTSPEMDLIVRSAAASLAALPAPTQPP